MGGLPALQEAFPSTTPLLFDSCTPTFTAVWVQATLPCPSSSVTQTLFDGALDAVTVVEPDDDGRSSSSPEKAAVERTDHQRPA